MRVFVAGATGAVGSRLVALLVAAGNSVAGLTRTPAKADAIRRNGADPVVADGLDASAVQSAVVAARPDVIVHAMTSLTGMSDLRDFDRTFAVSNRLRTEGMDILLAAAQQAGTRRIVAQSYCGWPYARVGGPVKSEDDPLDADPPKDQQQTLAAIRRLEQTVTATPGIDGIVLRYGAFYGPGTGMLEPIMVEQVRRRRVPLIGKAGGWWSFLHVDDAAGAVVNAINHGSRGVYNIVDDDPAPAREWLPELARILGAKKPLRVPKFLAALIAGRGITTMMTEGRAGSNAKAARELAWRPAYASWRQGFADALREHSPDHGR